MDARHFLACRNGDDNSPTVRQRALKRGYTLSEYALARIDDGSTVGAASEEEIYAALGMDWIPPELRENNGEIEAAESADHLPGGRRERQFGRCRGDWSDSEARRARNRDRECCAP